MIDSDLTADELRQIMKYDPDTGHFTRLTLVPGPKRASGTVGWVNAGGYLFASIRRRSYQLHRLAWLYVHGEWPKGDVDHINGDTTDNRIVNLRDVPKSMNLQNQLRPHARNKSGFLGVSWCYHRSKWRAHICVDGKNRSLGRYDTPELAHEAYLRAKRKLHSGSTL